MNAFLPSKRALEYICWDNAGSRQYIYFPPQYNELTLVSFLDGLVNQIPAFYWASYQVKIDKHTKPFNIGKIQIVWDAMSNAYAHGEATKYGLFYGLIMGKGGICHGFHDGGDFFRRADIKKKFENKQRMNEGNKNRKDNTSGHGMGIDVIFLNSDIIEVDASQGILYCMQKVGAKQAVIGKR